MASKGKLKKQEIKCGNKSIDGKRFVYDVIVHQVLKFGVPRNCICIWEGPENVYEYPNFLLVLSRLFLRHQISLRYKLHLNFNLHFESNKLESFQSVSRLLQNTIDNTRISVQMDITEKIEISLSTICELVIFLYSKNLNLYLKELACFWFDYHFRLVKKKFEKAGGIDKSYRKGNRLKHEYFDNFYDRFISVHCQSYEASARNENLEEIYCQSAEKFKNKVLATFTPKECQEMMKEVKRAPPRVKRITGYKFEITLPSSISEDETSETDLPENTGLGIIPHEELLKIVCESPSDATQSQNLPGTSQQESSKQRKGPSGRKKSKFRSSTSVEQGFRRLRLDSSGTKQSGEKKTDILETNDPTRSPNLPVASPRESASYQRVFSAEQKSNFMSCSSVKQRYSLDPPSTKLPGKKKSNVSATDASKESDSS